MSRLPLHDRDRMLMRVKGERRHWSQHHQYESPQSQQIASRGAPAKRHRNRCQGRESRPLPKKMQECPSQRLHRVWGDGL